MEQESPLFSIVIPVYNTVSELKRCTDSVLKQSFCDFEIVLVDDGSTDGSEKLCDQIASGDNRVISIHKVNGGSADARNFGTKHAKGRYILYLDSDDMWSSTTALEDLSKIINEINEIDVICFGVRISDEMGTIIKTRTVDAAPINVSDKKSVLTPLIYNNQYICASYVKCVKRELIENNNIYFIKKLISGEDIEWSSRIMIHCGSIAVYKDVFYERIRRSQGSITSAIGKRNIIDILKAVEKGAVYVRKHGEDKNMRNLYYEYWAYQYATLYSLLPGIMNDPEYDSIIERLIALKWLLRFNHELKVKALCVASMLIGVRNTVKLTGLYYKLLH